MISAMLQYIQRSPDCFHAVEELRQRLLREAELWLFNNMIRTVINCFFHRTTSSL